MVLYALSVEPGISTPTQKPLTGRDDDMENRREAILWPDDVESAWRHMGSKCCERCGQALCPCPKGPGADEPGFCGFYPCDCEPDRMGEDDDDA